MQCGLFQPRRPLKPSGLEVHLSIFTKEQMTWQREQDGEGPAMASTISASHSPGQ
jgi:hypothetical protein